MRKLLLLFALIPTIAFSQAIVQQSKTPPSGANAGNQYFQWYSGLFGGYLVLPIGSNATLNRSVGVEGQIYLQTSDTSIQVFHNGHFLPFGGGGSSSSIYFSSKYFGGLGTFASPIVFADTIKLQKQLYFQNLAHIAKFDSLQVLNAPVNGNGVVRKADLATLVPTIYTADGNLSGDRTVFGNGHSLNFRFPYQTGGVRFSIDSVLGVTIATSDSQFNGGGTLFADSAQVGWLLTSDINVNTYQAQATRTGMIVGQDALFRQRFEWGDFRDGTGSQKGIYIVDSLDNVGLKYNSSNSYKNGALDTLWIPNLGYIQRHFNAGYTFTNGLTLTGTTAKLGGTLSNSTGINLNGQNLWFHSISANNGANFGIFQGSGTSLIADTVQGNVSGVNYHTSLIQQPNTFGMNIFNDDAAAISSFGFSSTGGWALRDGIISHGIVNSGDYSAFEITSDNALMSRKAVRVYGNTLWATTSVAPANPTATAGASPVNGSATTYMRSDAAPKVDSTVFQTVLNFFPKGDTRYAKIGGGALTYTLTPTRGISGSAFNNTGNQSWGLDTTKNYTFLKQLSVNLNSSSLATLFTPGTTSVQEVGKNASDMIHEYRTFGGHFVSVHARAEGTPSSPTAVGSNVELGAPIDGAYYDGTNWPTEGFAVIQTFSGGGTPSTSNHEAYMVAKVTPLNSTTLTASGKWGSDLSYTSQGWLGAGQLTGGTNLFGYSSANTVGLTLYAPSSSSSRPVLELGSTGNTTQNNGEIDFDNLSNTLQSNYRSVIINATPAGAADGNQGATLSISTKVPDGVPTLAQIWKSDQTLQFNHYTTANGLLFTDGSGNVSQSTALPNGTTATTQSAGDNSTKVATTAYVATAVGTPVTAIGVTTANGVSGTSSGGTTPNLTITLGAITPTTVNGNTFTTGTYTLTGTAAKTLNFTNSLTLSGTDGTTMTFPATTATVARTDAAQTFTGNQTFSSQIFGTISSNGNTTSSNLYVPSGGTIGAASSSAPLLVDGAGAISARVILNGQTSTSIAAGNSYTGVEIGDQPMTIPSGTSALVSNLTVRAGALTITSGTVTDYANAYFQGRTSGASSTWNIWGKYGVSRFSGIQVDTLTASQLIQTDANKQLSSTTALPNGTTATTQTPWDNSTKISTTAYTDNGDQQDFALQAQAIGSTIKATTTGVSFNNAVSTASLVNNDTFLIPVFLKKGQTLTGVKVVLSQAGAYTPNNENRVGLYTYSGGTYTLVASSTNNGTLWTATANTLLTIPFSGTYVAAGGAYWVGIIYNNSAETTSPKIYVSTDYNSSMWAAIDATNSGKMYCVKTGTSTLGNITASGAIQPSSNIYLVMLY